MEVKREKDHAILLQPWLVSSVLAILFHHLFARRCELDVISSNFFGRLAATVTILLAMDRILLSSNLVDSVHNLVICGMSFTTTLALSILVYRAFFHRLNRFPGPFAARLTKFYAFKQSTSLQYHLELQKMHQKYGDIVRTGPRELSITRASALTHVMNCNKSLFYHSAGFDNADLAFVLTRDMEDHKQRRRPYEYALSQQSLVEHDPAIQRTIGIMLARLADAKDVDVTEMVSWLAYDLMGIIGFGRDFGNLTTGAENAAITALKVSTEYIGRTKTVPWLGNILLSIPGGTGEFKKFLDYCARLVKEKQRAWNEKAPEMKAARPKDVISWILKATEEGGPTGAPTQKALDSESRAVVMTGSDTSSTAIVNALYYLCRYQAAYKRLQAKVDAVFPGGPKTFSYTALTGNASALEHVDAVINETLRLKPPVPSGNPRVTPPEGLLIPHDAISEGRGTTQKGNTVSKDGGTWIPGDIDILMPQYVIQRDERYFARSSEFSPERWLPGENHGLIMDRNAWFPFQIGRFHCVGKQLAMWEMRSVLARVALQFNLSFPLGEDGARFDQGYKDTFTVTLPSLQMTFQERYEKEQ